MVFFVELRNPILKFNVIPSQVSLAEGNDWDERVNPLALTFHGERLKRGAKRVSKLPQKVL